MVIGFHFIRGYLLLSVMVELDKVAELLRNRYLANAPHCGYTSRLWWRLGTAGPTENVSPGDGSNWRKEIHCLFQCGNKMCIFLWFHQFLLFFLFLFHFMNIRW